MAGFIIGGIIVFVSSIVTNIWIIRYQRKKRIDAIYENGRKRIIEIRRYYDAS